MFSISLEDFKNPLQRELNKAFADVGIRYTGKDILKSIDKRKAAILNELLKEGQRIVEDVLPVDQVVLATHVDTSPPGAKFWPGSGKAKYFVVIDGKEYFNPTRERYPSSFEGSAAFALADFLEENGSTLKRTHNSLGGIPARTSTRWRAEAVRRFKKSQTGIIRRVINSFGNG